MENTNNVKFSQFIKLNPTKTEGVKTIANGIFEGFEIRQDGSSFIVSSKPSLSQTIATFRVSPLNPNAIMESELLVSCANFVANNADLYLKKSFKGLQFSTSETEVVEENFKGLPVDKLLGNQYFVDLFEKNVKTTALKNVEDKTLLKTASELNVYVENLDEYMASFRGMCKAVAKRNDNTASAQDQINSIFSK